MTGWSGRAGGSGRFIPALACFCLAGVSLAAQQGSAIDPTAVAVELRAADRGVPGDVVPQAGHVTVLNNARVRVWRVKLEGGQTLPDHQHAAGYVSIVVRGADGPGTWKWHPGGEAPATLDAARLPLEIVEVEPR